MTELERQYAQVKAFITDGPDAAGMSATAGLLHRVCQVAVRTLYASGAGASMMAHNSVRGICAASDPDAERLEELQFTLGEGPCIDAFASRRPVLIPDLAGGAMTRWPAYAPTVHDRGVQAVFAFPLQVGAARLGVLDVFRDRSGPLHSHEIQQAVLIGEVTVDALLDQHEQHGHHHESSDLDQGVGGRAELFQAQGMLMVQLGVSLDEAMVRMRAYAYAENRRISEVARDVVGRRLRLDADR